MSRHKPKKYDLPTICFLVACLALTSCSEESFSYSKLEGWPQVCKIGYMQSPIELKKEQSITFCDYNKIQVGFLDGKAKLTRVTENKIDYEVLHKNSIVSIVDYDRDLLEYLGESIVYKLPAEHILDGTTYPLEMQIRHKIFSGLPTSLTSKYPNLILSLLFRVDDSSTHNVLDDLLPTSLDDTVTVNFASVFSSGMLNTGSFYHYHGSKTSPSCSENVNWYIWRTVLPVRSEQLSRLTKATNGGERNSRTTQPTNSRPVYLVDAKCNTLMEFSSLGNTQTVQKLVFHEVSNSSKFLGFGLSLFLILLIIFF